MDETMFVFAIVFAIGISNKLNCFFFGIQDWQSWNLGVSKLSLGPINIEMFKILVWTWRVWNIISGYYELLFIIYIMYLIYNIYNLKYNIYYIYFRYIILYIFIIYIKYIIYIIYNIYNIYNI